jgi:hypothetical protein
MLTAEEANKYANELSSFLKHWEPLMSADEVIGIFMGFMLKSAILNNDEDNYAKAIVDLAETSRLLLNRERKYDA